MSFKPEPLTGDELVVLRWIAESLRRQTVGMASGRKTIASVIGRKMGRSPSPSLRALCALADLNRPRRETLDDIAKAIGSPELAAVWWARWESIPHPTRKAEGTP